MEIPSIHPPPPPSSRAGLSQRTSPPNATHQPKRETTRQLSPEAHPPPPQRPEPREKSERAPEETSPGIPVRVLELPRKCHGRGSSSRTLKRLKRSRPDGYKPTRTRRSQRRRAVAHSRPCSPAKTYFGARISASRNAEDITLGRSDTQRPSRNRNTQGVGRLAESRQRAGIRRADGEGERTETEKLRTWPRAARPNRNQHVRRFRGTES